jgi:hypothetical protein
MRIWTAWKIYRQVKKLHETIEVTSVKKFWQSKTIIFQLLTIVAAVTNVVPLPADVTAAIVAAINVGLRLVTSQSVSA